MLADSKVFILEMCTKQRKHFILEILLNGPSKQNVQKI